MGTDEKERIGCDDAGRSHPDGAELCREYDHLAEAQRLSRTGSFTWDVLADEHNWSHEIRRIFGFESDVKVTIDMIRAAVDPDDLPDLTRVIAGATEGRNFELVFRLLTAQGEVRHARVVGHRLEHIPDRLIFVGALQDVTESRVAEAALKKSEAELRRTNQFLATAQKLSKTGSFIWNLAADERQWSEEMYRLLEQEPDIALPSAIIRDLIHPEDLATLEALNRQASAGRDFDGEFRLLLPSGRAKTVRVVGIALDANADQPVFVCAAQDVTELRLREVALDMARAQLAHVARVVTLSTLTASIAHEVSQPLSGILNNANACLRMLAAEPPNLQGIADAARRSVRDVDRAAGVINRLRSLFAKKSPVTEVVDLAEAAQEVIALAASELQRSGVLVQTAFVSDLPSVLGDRIQLQQVMLNLLMNAAESMAGLDDRARVIALRTDCDDAGRVVFSVDDAGRGIDPQDLGRVFEAFFTTKAQGMGVGLSVSRSIIERHGGQLWASPNEGPGVTFSFSVPHVTAPA